MAPPVTAGDVWLLTGEFLEAEGKSIASMKQQGGSPPGGYASTRLTQCFRPSHSALLPYAPLCHSPVR